MHIYHANMLLPLVINQVHQVHDTYCHSVKLLFRAANVPLV